MELTILINIFFFQAEDGIRDATVTGVQTCALPIFLNNIFNIIISASPKKNFYWKLNLTRATTYGVERQNIECEMSERGLEWILRNLDRSEERRVGKECN